MNPKPLPPKAARRLSSLGLEIARMVNDAVAAGHPADATLSSFFASRRELGSRDRRFLGDLVFSFFRWRGWVGVEATPLACAIAHLLDSASVHPAAAEMAVAAGMPREELRPLLSADLPSKARAVAGWLDDDAVPAPDSLVPDWLRAELHAPPESDTDEHVKRFIRVCQERPPTWLRLKRGQEDTTLRLLSSHGIIARGTSPLERAIAIPPASPLRSLPAADRTGFEVQDLASQYVAAACRPSPGESWWDACAGSGGKSLHLADLLGGRGSVLATDVRPAALLELQRRVALAGAPIIRWLSAGRQPEGLFDGVLVDAPCSGVGTWARNPDARWRTPVSEVRDRALTQGALLEKCCSAVKPGGVLVYAVCTVTNAETAGVVEAFRAKHPDFAPERPEWISASVLESDFVWVWPWHGPCDGMFVARFRRAKP